MTTHSNEPATVYILTGAMRFFDATDGYCVYGCSEFAFSIYRLRIGTTRVLIDKTRFSRRTNASLFNAHKCCVQRPYELCVKAVLVSLRLKLNYINLNFHKFSPDSELRVMRLGNSVTTRIGGSVTCGNRIRDNWHKNA